MSEEDTKGSNDPQNETFGVDAETKDLHVTQMYTWLLNTYKGNRVEINKHLYTRGFLHHSFLEKNINKENLEKNINKENKDLGVSEDADNGTFLKKLELLSEKWYENSIVKQKHLAEEFRSDKNLLESYTNSIVLLKYIELYGARFWQNVWAKDMRGVVLFIHPETNDVKCLSYKLPRGAEVATNMCKNVETQDIKSGKFNILDLEQQDTCNKLINGSSVDLHLTAKADGSLLVITSFIGEALRIVKPIVDIFGSEYVKLWAQQSLKLSKGQRLLIPSTQGTFLEAGYMAHYMVTSMLVASDIVDRTELKRMEDSNKSYCNAWMLYGEKFIEKFLSFNFFDNLTESQTFCFEAICKDRCGLFGDRCHTELACSYERDRLIFLGTSISDKRFYIPHSVYSELSHIPFEQPLWWNINDSLMINRMLTSLNHLLLNKMTKSEFLSLYPSSNKKNNDFKDADIILDFEGFVAMKIASLKILDDDHLTVCKSLNIPLMVYSKIKTPEYYLMHKFRPENTHHFIELSRTAGHIFPLSRKIAGIYEKNDLVRRMKIIGTKTMELLDFDKPDSDIIKKLHTIYQNTLTSIEEKNKLGDKIKIPKNPLSGFEKRPLDVKCRMTLNFTGFDFGELLIPIFSETFPEFNENTNATEIKAMLKNIMMTLQPWNHGYEDRIKDLTPNSLVIRDLVTVCIGMDISQEDK
jgi:hypothetical protein